ncbi:MAG: hypothetical protein FJ275_11010, partial [Planctomycetes bacterium]|nr:hypothetical protein [Planctomycetota bacterium]
AEFLLGRSSPSDDLETPVVVEAAPRHPTRDEIKGALAGFRGEIRQRPCDYSAVHVDGKRAYRLARRGREITLPEKAVRIDRLEVTGYDWPRLALAIDCSTGTFVRAIGRDLAAALGTTAVMESLVRTAVGPFLRVGAIPFAALTADTVAAAVMAPLDAVPHLPQATLADDLLDRAVRGGLVSLPASVSTPRVSIPSVDPADAVAAVDVGGALVGILRPHDSGGWRLRPNFRGLG